MPFNDNPSLVSLDNHDFDPSDECMIRSLIHHYDTINFKPAYITRRVNEKLNVQISVESVIKVIKEERENSWEMLAEQEATKRLQSKMFSSYLRVIQESWDAYELSLFPIEKKTTKDHHRKYDRLVRDSYCETDVTTILFPPKPNIGALATILRACAAICELLGLNSEKPAEIPTHLAMRGMVGFDAQAWNMEYKKYYDDQGRLIMNRDDNPYFNQSNNGDNNNGNGMQKR